MAIGATYKIYDASADNGNGAWVEYYFKTSAQLVGVDATRKFLTSSVTVNGVAFTLANNVTGVASVTIDASDIESVPVSPSQDYTLQYVGAQNETIDESLGKLDYAIANVGSTLTDFVPYTGATGNVDLGNNSLSAGGGVYAGEIHIFDYTSNDNTTSFITTGNTDIVINPDGHLYYGSSLPGNEVATRGWAVPQTRTINGNALSSDITVYAVDIPISSSAPNTSVVDAIQSIQNAISGMTTSYAIEYTNVSSAYVNGGFNSTNDTITITGTSEAELIELDGDVILLTDLKIGDSIFVSETNVPDRWLSSITYANDVYSYTFSKLESYNMAWDAITGTPTTLQGYGITDAVPYTGATDDLNLGDNELKFTVSQNEGRMYYDGDDFYILTSDGDIVLNPDGIAKYGGSEIATKNDLAGYVPFASTGTVDLGNNSSFTASSMYANSLTVGGMYFHDTTENNNTTSWISTGNSPLVIDPDTNLYYHNALPENEIATKGDLGDFVPYTGATGSVDLGNNSLSADGGVSAGEINIYDYTINDVTTSYIATGNTDIVINPDGHLYYGSSLPGNEVATHDWVGSQGYIKCTAATTAPSNPNSGDIWIDTN